MTWVNGNRLNTISGTILMPNFPIRSVLIVKISRIRTLHDIQHDFQQAKAQLNKAIGEDRSSTLIVRKLNE